MSALNTSRLYPGFPGPLTRPSATLSPGWAGSKKHFFTSSKGPEDRLDTPNPIFLSRHYCQGSASLARRATSFPSMEGCREATGWFPGHLPEPERIQGFPRCENGYTAFYPADYPAPAGATLLSNLPTSTPVGPIPAKERLDPPSSPLPTIDGHKQP